MLEYNKEPFPKEESTKTTIKILLHNITEIIETAAAKEYTSLGPNTTVLIQTNWGWLHDSFKYERLRKLKKKLLDKL